MDSGAHWSSISTPRAPRVTATSSVAPCSRGCEDRWISRACVWQAPPDVHRGLFAQSKSPSNAGYGRRVHARAAQERRSRSQAMRLVDESLPVLVLLQRRVHRIDLSRPRRVGVCSRGAPAVGTGVAPGSPRQRHTDTGSICWTVDRAHLPGRTTAWRVSAAEGRVLVAGSSRWMPRLRRLPWTAFQRSTAARARLDEPAGTLCAWHLHAHRPCLQPGP